MPGGWMSGSGGGLSEADVKSLLDKVYPNLILPGFFLDSTYAKLLYYNFINSTNPSDTDKAYMVPIILGYETINISSIAIEVTTSISTTSARLAIYDSDGANKRPKTLLLDAGLIDTTSTGNKEILTDIDLSGLVYLSYACNSGSVGVACFDAADSDSKPSMNPYGYSSATQNKKSLGLRYNFTLGAVGAEISYPADIESDFDQHVDFFDMPRIMLETNTIT